MNFIDDKENAIFIMVYSSKTNDKNFKFCL